MEKSKKQNISFSLYDPLLDSIADGLFAIDEDFIIISFNRAAENITGIKREEAIGKPCWTVFKATICEHECALKETLESGTPIIDKPIHIISIEGKKKPVSISTALLRDEQGQTIGGVETFRDLSQVEALRKELNNKYSFSDIISRNSKMQELFHILPEIARSETSVLITGESGTGKELIAHALHEFSHRNQGPFVTVNCGAIPETLLESELFGYEKGAFTGAVKSKPGRFATAEKGSLFLDEIGDLPLLTQVKLLRVLEQKTYEPLGSLQTLKADVRIIGATNSNLHEKVEQGHFREDLYYRINVINLKLPPLRERMEDVPLLAQHFIEHFNHVQNKNIKGLHDSTMAALMKYDFPGNIRELKNIIERAFVLCQRGLIEVQHLPEQFDKNTTHQLLSEQQQLDEMERRYIEMMLERHDGNRQKTAKSLGIHRSTLHRKLTTYGIPHKSVAKRDKQK